VPIKGLTLLAITSEWRVFDGCSHVQVKSRTCVVSAARRSASRRTSSLTVASTPVCGLSAASRVWGRSSAALIWGVTPIPSTDASRSHSTAFFHPCDERTIGRNPALWVLLLRGTVVERRSLTGELSLFCARPTADGCPLMWANRPLQVSQPGRLSLSFFRGR